MFDSVEELLRQIRLGEDSAIEFKTIRFQGERIVGPKRDDLADELAAIANSGRAGVLVFGVDDKTRDINGIPVKHLDTVERLILEICEHSIEPPLHFYTFRLELPDLLGEPQPVLKVEIPRSLFVHRSPGGYFRRVGSSKRPISPDVLARLFQQRSQARLIRFDEQPVPETRFQDLDEALWRRFLGTRTDDPVVILRKMKILTEEESGEERVSVAGILMCSRRPAQWLPSAFIQAVRYRGVRQDSNYQIDAQEVHGAVDEQVRTALKFIQRNMRVAARKMPARVEIPQFSLQAVFEAVVNAVAHRDYSVHGSKIRLFLFDDRLELYSPGSLPNTITIDSLALRQSTRNELLTSLLAKCALEDLSDQAGRMFLMEKRGDGVPIILDETARLAGELPEYRLLDDAELLLTIPSASPHWEDDIEES